MAARKQALSAWCAVQRRERDEEHPEGEEEEEAHRHGNGGATGTRQRTYWGPHEHEDDTGECDGEFLVHLSQIGFQKLIYRV